MRLRILSIIFCLTFILNATEFSPKLKIDYQLELAKDLYDHNFLDDALELLIGLYNYPRTPKEYKAQALYLMGEISYEKKDFDSAINDWSKFSKEFPEHELIDAILSRLANIKQAILKDKNYTVSATDIANNYYRHHFNEIAKEKFLAIYHNPQSSIEEKAKALFILGQIIFEEGDYVLALEDWELLITKFPDTEYAKEIIERMEEIDGFITYDSKGTRVPLLARAYLQNGDFWSNADRKFIIDSSWMPDVELALHWYDKVLSEFPNSPSAEEAYRRKLFTLMGSSEPKRNQPAFGLKEDFAQYMPEVLETFSNFERDFPENSYLQGFRYQIAQAYWAERDAENAKIWLRKIILAGGGKETFYTETARARLNNLEYWK